jgi:hypothetical protein
MNWGKGFFRLWVLAVFLWVAGIILTAIGSWPPFSEHKYYAWNSGSGNFKGVDWTDNYELEKAINAGQHTAVESPEGFTVVFGNGVERSQVNAGVRKVREAVEGERPLRIKSHIAAAAVFAIVPPIVILLGGLALAWVIGGFRRA